ncbi:MAG TPA: glycosyltransferase family 2 protein, partial [Chitinophagaceae bacterium]|nr:glycosyltransferase family 2 protein [Chitinophagaceae bacterium]
MNRNCSLLIATYNWPQALELCLMSVMNQKIMPAEVVIADDGSKKETGDLIAKIGENFPVPLRHVWQPDEGFQLARIRNRAIAAASGAYILQIDGDLILHPYFVHDHLALQRPGFFTTGSRVLLSPLSTERLLQQRSLNIKAHASDSRNRFNSLRSPLLRNIMAPRYKTGGRHRYYVKGCNMAFWKEDLLRVNGYNEAFSGWGREDSEIAIRLINAGVQKQFMKMGGICYHLYHKEASRAMEQRNIQ